MLCDYMKKSGFCLNLLRMYIISLCSLNQFVFNFFAGQLYGLEKFWAFLKYSRKQVDVDPKLREWLSKYKRLEDFRVEVFLYSYHNISGNKIMYICMYMYLSTRFKLKEAAQIQSYILATYGTAFIIVDTIMLASQQCCVVCMHYIKVLRRRINTTLLFSDVC